MIGKVYKLSAPNCDKVYIGSTYCKYTSVRLAHHRQYNRNGWKDYKGLFDNGDPHMDIIDEIPLAGRHENWKLRKLEEEHSLNYDNKINLRRCYVEEDEKIKARDKMVKKYHSSELGKLALRKASLNAKLKKMENGEYKKKIISQSDIDKVKAEIKSINEKQEYFRNHHKAD